MAARLRATWAPGPGRLTRECLGLCLCAAAGIVASTAAGCASSSATVAGPANSATPSFMLSEQEKAERNLKDPAALHLAYGHFEEQVGQSDEARNSYEKALAANPHAVEAVLGIARLDQLADKPKEAEAGFQKALKMKPGDAAVMAACGQFYASQQRWPDAMSYLKGAVAAAPKVPIYKHQLAVVATRAGDINTGLAIFNQLVGPDKAHYNVAYLLTRDGKRELAAQQCRAALAINPKFEPAKAMLDQMQNQVAGDPRGVNRPATAGPATPGSLRPVTASVSPSANGFAPAAVGSSNQPLSTATQASWQAGASGSNGFASANRADGSFDAALPKSNTVGTMPAADSSSDPWAPPPAPPR
jgi:tetratricopeptide (TPR) repeat protein